MILLNQCLIDLKGTAIIGVPPPQAKWAQRFGPPKNDLQSTAMAVPDPIKSPSTNQDLQGTAWIVPGRQAPKQQNLKATACLMAGNPEESDDLKATANIMLAAKNEKSDLKATANIMLEAKKKNSDLKETAQITNIPRKRYTDNGLDKTPGFAPR